ncbi:hypothetical protein PR048_005720 [Dryococelus australis]|uniref:Uncharacterized protein n=1 Tax=Dryococelus australis TaxID=614101 RepID=A0ABQ9I9J0_9NEOP|nr:hypothetical protein PR048_005720 [Dryococelus australis]
MPVAKDECCTGYVKTSTPSVLVQLGGKTYNALLDAECSHSCMATIVIRQVQIRGPRGRGRQAVRQPLNWTKTRSGIGFVGGKGTHSAGQVLTDHRHFSLTTTLILDTSLSICTRHCPSLFRPHRLGRWVPASHVMTKGCHGFRSLAACLIVSTRKVLNWCPVFQMASRLNVALAITGIWAHWIEEIPFTGLCTSAATQQSATNALPNFYDMRGKVRTSALSSYTLASCASQPREESLLYYGFPLSHSPLTHMPDITTKRQSVRAYSLRLRETTRLSSSQNDYDSLWDRSRNFVRDNREVQCRWSAGFLDNPPFPPPLHSGVAPYSPHSTLIDSQDLAVKRRPNLFTHSLNESAPTAWGRRASELFVLCHSGHPVAILSAMLDVGRYQKDSGPTYTKSTGHNRASKSYLTNSGQPIPAHCLVPEVAQWKYGPADNCWQTVSGLLRLHVVHGYLLALNRQFPTVQVSGRQFADTLPTGCVCWVVITTAILEPVYFTSTLKQSKRKKKLMGEELEEGDCVLITDEGEAKCVWSSLRIQRLEKWEIPEKTQQPAASSSNTYFPISSYSIHPTFITENKNRCRVVRIWSCARKPHFKARSLSPVRALWKGRMTLFMHVINSGWRVDAGRGKEHITTTRAYTRWFSVRLRG